jgi:FtsH-binding integral membrane protein
MIQRIQSIFLVLAAAGGVSLLALPFSEADQVVESSTIFQDAQYTIQDHPALMILFLLGAALALGAIFLFKNRTTQIRVSIFSFIASFIGLILAVTLFMQDPMTSSSVEPGDGAGLYVTIGIFVFLLLAIRFIRKDHKVVQSMDRLR